MKDRDDRILKYLNMVETCEEAYNICQLELSQWDCEFLDSVKIQLHKDKTLSWKQSKCPLKIYEKIG